MNKILITIFIFSSIISNAQLTSLVVRNDTLFNVDPSTGVWTQLTKTVPPQTNQSGKVISTNGTVFQWITLPTALSQFTNDVGFIPSATVASTYVPKTVTINGRALSGNISVTASDLNLGNVDNTSDANKPISSATQTALNLKQNTISVLPFANGGISGAAATSATTGTMTVNMTSRVITITPTGNCTFNASGGVAGQTVTFSITTSGVSSFTLTFGTNFRKTGTLATGTTSARFFTVTFICLDGVIWSELCRTAAQT